MTNGKKPKKTQTAVSAGKLVKGPVLTWLEDLEELAREAGKTGEQLELRASCCGGPVTVVWMQREGYLVVGCDSCHVAILRLALARRPLVEKAGAAVKG